MTVPVMVGRRTELAALQALLDAAHAGRGSCALIGGEAGVGKSRLTRAVKQAAAARQMRVIEGRSSPAEVAVPYGPFLDALRFRLARGEGETAARVLDPVLAHLAPLFPVLRGDASALAEATARPFEPVWHVLQRLAALGPTLLVLEDVHWADPTSHELIHYIAQRVASIPLLVLATYRTDEVQAGPSLLRLLAALARERDTVRIHLEPFGTPEIASLLAAMLGRPPDPALVTAVQQRTEGNPFFIEEVVGDLVSGARPEHAPGAAAVVSLGVPATLQEIVRDRMTRLPPDAREAALAAAVIGPRFRFDVLATVLGWPEERLLTALEALLASRTLIEARGEREESYAFRHSLVHQALYEGTMERRRRVWHRRVAEALESVVSPESLPHTALAHHYQLAGEELRARDHAILAGAEAVRLCAWQVAAERHASALAAIERTGNDARLRADVLEGMAEVAWWQSRLADVDRCLEEALALRRRLGDRRGCARVLRRVSVLAADQHDQHARALEALREARMLAAPASPDRAGIANDLGRLLLTRGDAPAAEALFMEALHTGVEREDCTEHAFALAMLGALAISHAQVTAGTHRLELARSLLLDEQVPMRRVAEIYHTGVRAFHAVRDHRRARDWVNAALDEAARHHAQAEFAIFRAYDAAIARRAGAWAAAVETGRLAVEDLRTTGRAELREALRILGDLERGRGRLSIARAAYEEAIALGDDDARVGRALAEAAEHHWEAALCTLEEQLERRGRIEPIFRLRVLPIMIEGYAAAGEIGRAVAAFEQLGGALAGCDYPVGAAILPQAHACVSAARGDGPGAIRLLREAVHAWNTLGLPHEAARASLLLSETILQFTPQDHGEAVAAGTRAAVTFEELGATLDLSRAQRALRRAGVRIARRRRCARAVPAPLDCLTDRELEVLAEIARGRSNKQVARTLSLSPRTVGNHVSAILGKLGCATRVEASRIALHARLDAEPERLRDIA